MKPWVLTGLRVWRGPERGAGGDSVALDPVGGRVLAVGSRAEATAAAGPRARVEDGGGRWLVPGFVDPHIHLTAMAAAAASGADCSDVQSAGELLERVARRAAATTGGWVSLHGLEHRLEGGTSFELPSPELLEAAAGSRPVRVRHRSLHGWVLGPQAAAAAGCSPGWAADPAGAIARRLPPAHGAAALDSGLEEVSRELLRAGVTACLDTGAANGTAELARLRGWRSAGILRQDARALTRSRCPGSAGRKLLPEADWSVARMRALLEEAWSWADLVAVHCADVETLGLVIEAAEAVQALGGRRRTLRVEHAVSCPPEWIPRLAGLNAAVVTHPAMVWAHGARYSRDADCGPASWLYRLRSWIAGGVRLAFGSDAPAGPALPILQLRAAVQRRCRDGTPFGPQETVDTGTALAALTAWPADLSGFKHQGRLEAGQAGSAVLLAGDPWRAPGELEVAGVIHRGRWVA